MSDKVATIQDIKDLLEPLSNKIDDKFGHLDDKFNHLEKRIDGLEIKFDKMRVDLNSMDKRIDNNSTNIKWIIRIGSAIIIGGGLIAKFFGYI
ncbi:MAG: hypothetical protein OXC67_09910 [Flavobacteriaceae bacterium]|nr:hypothetical protein [Flavobacteriaceae bacterium]